MPFRNARNSRNSRNSRLLLNRYDTIRYDVSRLVSAKATDTVDDADGTAKAKAKAKSPAVAESPFDAAEGPSEF